MSVGTTYLVGGEVVLPSGIVVAGITAWSHDLDGK